MSFTASTFQNEYLPAGSREVHAVVTVTAGGTLVQSGPPGEKAVVLIVDTSGSMNQPATKMSAARKAIAAAVDELPDGTLFAVIAGSQDARVVYPPNGTDLVAASDATRREAIGIAGKLQAEGGTAMSQWLGLARTLFERRPGAIRLAYLVTDGKNESEARDDLLAVLHQCQGVFQCDARGVGAKWVVDELRLVTSALLGDVDIIATPDEMDDDFRAFLEDAIGKQVGDVSLRVWTPAGANVRFVRQVAPAISDLRDKAVKVNDLTYDHPTGAWSGNETRDYHVCIDVVPGEVGEEKLAARVGLVVDGEMVSQALVRAVWTDDQALSTRINAQVAHYTGQAELAVAIHDGLEARKRGDERSATLKLGRAVQLAHESGNEATVRLLQGVVEVDDPATGTVRLRRDVAAVAEMALDTRSTRTVRVNKS